MYLTEAPFSPGGPGLPLSPWGPLDPTAPSAPGSPLGPDTPLSPIIPGGPGGPVAPGFPCKQFLRQNSQFMGSVAVFPWSYPLANGSGRSLKASFANTTRLSFSSTVSFGSWTTRVTNLSFLAVDSWSTILSWRASSSWKTWRTHSPHVTRIAFDSRTAILPWNTWRSYVTSRTSHSSISFSSCKAITSFWTNCSHVTLCSWNPCQTWRSYSQKWNYSFDKSLWSSSTVVTS